MTIPPFKSQKALGNLFLSCKVRRCACTFSGTLTWSTSLSTSFALQYLRLSRPYGIFWVEVGILGFRSISSSKVSCYKFISMDISFRINIFVGHMVNRIIINIPYWYDFVQACTCWAQKLICTSYICLKESLWNSITELLTSKSKVTKTEKMGKRIDT